MARPHRYAKRCGREYWSVGVLREVRIAPRVAGWRAADSLFDIPVNMVTEQSRFYRPFGADLFLLRRLFRSLDYLIYRYKQYRYRYIPAILLST
jgi:hypothetical protein